MYVVGFDTETTGLDLGSEIIEIGAIRWDLNFNEVDLFHSLIKPRNEISEESSKVHNMTAEMFLNKPDMKDVLPEFLNFLVKEKSVVIAHNALFDLRHLQYAVKLEKMELPEVIFYDSLEFARFWAYSEMKSHKLEALAKEVGVTLNHHRAVDDVKMMKEVIRSGCKKIGIGQGKMLELLTPCSSNGYVYDTRYGYSMIE